MTETTIYLLQLFAIVFFVAGISVMLNVKMFKNMAKDIKNDGLFVLYAYLPLIIGAMIVLKHNVWSNQGEIFVSLIGWLALIKGVVRFVFPENSRKMLASFSNSKYLIHFGCAVSVFGIYLGWLGFVMSAV